MGRPVLDLTGERYGRLVMLEKVGQLRFPKCRSVYWKAQCDCGETAIVSSAHVRKGTTTSCGCYNKELVSTHGGTNHPLYKTWIGMNQRCARPSTAKERRNYYDKGIRVCERWIDTNPKGFWNFVDDMGERPERHTLDRIDGRGNYEPSNCRWATYREQNLNQDRSHGKCGTYVYSTWDERKRKGTLIPEWANDFKAFYAGVGDPPAEGIGLRLYRPNRNEPMGPNNFRWTI